jgi:8-oxo-dGTP pyrophosphatase MutT (NUDIX family)
MMRVYWGAAHPHTHGALVAIWRGGEILLVKNSYVPYYSLPGGYVRSSETGRDAALRELYEETGLRASAADLKPALDEQHEWEGKREHIEIFELDVTEAPAIAVDRREVVAAAFHSPSDALRLDLFPPLRRVIERRMAPAAQSYLLCPPWIRSSLHRARPMARRLVGPTKMQPRRSG